MHGRPRQNNTQGVTIGIAVIGEQSGRRHIQRQPGVHGIGIVLRDWGMIDGVDRDDTRGRCAVGMTIADFIGETHLAGEAGRRLIGEATTGNRAEHALSRCRQQGRGEGMSLGVTVIDQHARRVHFQETVLLHHPGVVIRHGRLIDGCGGDGNQRCHHAAFQLTVTDGVTDDIVTGKSGIRRVNQVSCRIEGVLPMSGCLPYRQREFVAFRVRVIGQQVGRRHRQDRVLNHRVEIKVGHGRLIDGRHDQVNHANHRVLVIGQVIFKTIDAAEPDVGLVTERAVTLQLHTAVGRIP